MSPKQFRMHDGKRGSALAVRVTPRARKNEISEVMSDGTIKIRLTAPPVEGKANDALIDFLADVLNVPNSKIEIVAGHTGRDKLVSILDMDSAIAQERILDHIAA